MEFEDIHGMKIPKEEYDKLQAELEVFKTERRAIWKLLHGYQLNDALDILLMVCVEAIQMIDDKDIRRLPEFMSTRQGAEVIALQRMLWQTTRDATGSEAMTFLMNLAYLHHRLPKKGSKHGRPAQ